MIRNLRKARRCFRISVPTPVGSWPALLPRCRYFITRKPSPLLSRPSHFWNWNPFMLPSKKNFVPSYLLLLAISILQVVMFISSLREDPVVLLSNSARLFSGLCFSLLSLLLLVELFRYFFWYSKAKRAAEYGEFLNMPNTSGFQKIIFAIIFTGILYWIASSLLWGNSMQRWLAFFPFIYVPVLFLSVNGVKEFLKRRKASRSVNRTFTILTSFVSAFIMLGLVTFLLLRVSSGIVFAG